MAAYAPAVKELAPVPVGRPERLQTERGQGMVEYAFILALIALVLIVAVATLGNQTNTLYSNISNALPR